MKKFKNFAVIVAALTMALAIIAVPAVSAIDTITVSETVGTITAPADTTHGAITLPETVGTITAPETVGTITAPEDATCPVPVQHVCTISKAFATHHVVDCECGEYSHFAHADLAEEPVNEFFHKVDCACGYTSSERHSFRTAYDANSHKEVCIDCGYEKAAQPHVWENTYYGNYHDVQCADCGYLAEHHVGVSFESIDGTSCQASCHQCGLVEIVAHDFCDFECDNCEYVVSGLSYGIVEDIREMDDGGYRIRFLVNGNSHRITIEDAPDFNEGDFVEIDHYGNTIFGISVMVSGDVVDAPEAFPYYIQSDMIKEKAETFFDAILVDSVEFREDKTIIQYETGKIIRIDNNYIVYNLVNGEMFELSENYAYLSFVKNETRYFIAIW